MSKPIERRIEALEQAETDGTRKIDLSFLTREERAEYRGVLESIGDGRLTFEEARAHVAQHGIGPRRLGAEDQAQATTTPESFICI